MARLLSWPRGLGRLGYQRLKGPRAQGEAGSESVTGFVQTTASAFGGWSYQISLPPLRGRKYRLYRALVTALHGGANAVKVPFSDPDVMSWAESGVTIAESAVARGVAWSNGKTWSNGKNWAIGRPTVAVAADAAQGDTTIALADTAWGHGLIGGEWIGFFPFHFGKYEITQVFGDGEYRIWPPLRRALTAGVTRATLRPVMAMRLPNEAAGTVQRGVTAAEGNALTLIEVEDRDVRDFFSE